MKVKHYLSRCNKSNKFFSENMRDVVKLLKTIGFPVDLTYPGNTELDGNIISTAI